MLSPRLAIVCASVIEWVRSKHFAWLGVLAPIWGLLSVLIAAWLSPWFEWNANAISDMGVYESGRASAFALNLGLISVGSFIILFIMWLWSRVVHRLERMGTIVLGGASLSLVGIGVFTETFGRIHFFVSVMFFVLAPVAMWFFAASWLQDPAKKWFGIWFILLSLVTVFVWSLPWDGIAIPEFISALADCVEIISFSVFYPIRDAE